MDKPIYGYSGKQLRISLNSRKVTVENIDPKVLRKYLGGAGYGARILYDELKKGIDPLSKANEVDNVVGAGVDTVAAAGAFIGVDDDDAVVPLVDSFGFTGGYTGGFVTVLAHVVHVADSHLGHGSLNDVGNLHPELAGIGLWLGDGRPVIADVLVLAGDLTVVAAVAFVNVNYQSFHYCCLPP